MNAMFAQGDLLIERVSDHNPSGLRIAPDGQGVMVLAEGEMTGHRHVILEQVTMFRDDALARDMPPELYIGHVKVGKTPVQVVHDEHAPVALSEGTYRVRRQRELEPKEASFVAD